MDNIFQQGTIFKNEKDKTIYLTPDEPLVYDANKWEYKYLPSITEFKQHVLKYQKVVHFLEKQMLNVRNLVADVI